MLDQDRGVRRCLVCITYTACAMLLPTSAAARHRDQEEDPVSGTCYAGISLCAGSVCFPYCINAAIYITFSEVTMRNALACRAGHPALLRMWRILSIRAWPRSQAGMPRNAADKADLHTLAFYQSGLHGTRLLQAPQNASFSVALLGRQNACSMCSRHSRSLVLDTRCEWRWRSACSAQGGASAQVLGEAEKPL